MKINLKVPSITLVLLAGMLICVWPAAAAVPVAKISDFKGNVVVQSGANIAEVSMVGHVLKDGDRVQTKQGEAQITFQDGAIMKMRPFSVTMVQEREEEGGFLFFKTKNLVRRITCFVGKAWFKSGNSKRKNFLQTPTAVCGLRGSDGDFGYNPDTLQSYLNMYTGNADVIGDVLQGVFADPGISAAQKSKVFQRLEAAGKAMQNAKDTGTTADVLRAKINLLQVGKAVADGLEKNPDETVQNDAKGIDAVADAEIAAAKVEVALETLKAIDPDSDQIDDIEKTLSQTEQMADQTAKQVDQGNLDAARSLADNAIRKSDEVFGDILTAVQQAAEEGDVPLAVDLIDLYIELDTIDVYEEIEDLDLTPATDTGEEQSPV